MNAAFKGRGWRFPIQPDALGRLDYTEAEENIEHSLKVILLTALGERTMRYAFGCDAARLVFAPGSRRYLGLLETTVRETVRDWEPRIELEQVVAEQDTQEAERVNVSIDYRVRQTNTRANLVFPFYLGTLEIG
jgi:phage baseplate assembly protein W